MRRVVERAAGLTLIYLLVLTSVRPGDLLVGAALSLAVAYALRVPESGAAHLPIRSRLPAALGVAGATIAEVVRGSWQVSRFCLGRPASPGLVEIPREDRSPAAVALWGVLTGEAPDEVVVDVDEERGTLLVHVLDAGDPDGIRARHSRDRVRQRRVVG
jgi:multisubunit Na+/H+ antiporter MnhE subunit